SCADICASRGETCQANGCSRNQGLFRQSLCTPFEQLSFTVNCATDISGWTGFSYSAECCCQP
ncbi:MAG: hypothetical protein AAGA56_29185, partial [Myxococcota bacterium]